MRGSPDWDALAPYWHHFEGGGLTLHLLARAHPLLRPPLLYVGSGLGAIPAALATRFGADAVVCVDRSVAMSQRARRDHALACVAADGRHLPFPDDAFATLVCAAGVLEYLDVEQLIAMLVEMGRVGGHRGQVLAYAACSDGGVRWDIDQHQFVEAWHAGRSGTASARAFDAVAEAMGSRDAARELLLSSIPRQGRAIAGETLAAAAHQAGLRVAATHIDKSGICQWLLFSERNS